MSTGSALARFTITLSQAVTEPVQVEWFTSDGTAKAAVDYAANKGTAVFAPGDTAKTVDILVYGRAVGDEDRSFFVEMLPPVNAILGASIGECIIHVDTVGSTPVTRIIVPTGPEGDSAYQVWLDMGNTGTEQDFFDSLKPDPAEIAIEVAPLIDVGDTVLTAEGTETLGRPDATTVKAIARRVAYSGAAKIATVVLADGDNLIASGDLVGDAIDLNSAGISPRILRGTSFLSPLWRFEPGGSLLISGAVAGDVLYVCQYDFSSSDAFGKRLASGEGASLSGFKPYGSTGLSTVEEILRGASALIPGRLGFFEDSGGVNIHRLRDRILMGDAARYTGNRQGINGYGESWITKYAASWILKNAVAASSTDDGNAGIGFLGASRTAPGVTPTFTNCGVAGLTLNEGANTFGRAFYAEVMHKSPNGTTVGLEVQGGNYTSKVPVANAYSMGGSVVNGLMIGMESGNNYTVGDGDTPIPLGLNPGGAGIDFCSGSLFANFQKWTTGIVFRDQSLLRDGNGMAVAMSMAQKQTFNWEINGSATGAKIWSEVVDPATPVGLRFTNKRVQMLGVNNRIIVDTVDDTAGAGAVNHPLLKNARTGANIALGAEGSDANAGVDIYSQGNGSLRLMSHGGTADNLRILPPSAAPVNYLTIAGAIAGSPVGVGVGGTDADISLRLSPKGAGQVIVGNTIRPSAANTYTSGTSVAPWAGGFTQTAYTITSDATHKSDPLIMTDVMLDAWQEVEWVQFQYLDRIEEKGEDGARWHFGVIAQRAKEAFERHGLDAHRYGFLCYDEWDDQYIKVQTNEGALVTKTRTIQKPELVTKTHMVSKPVMTTELRDVLVDAEAEDGTPIKKLVQKTFMTPKVNRIYVFNEDGSPHLDDKGNHYFVGEPVMEEVSEEYQEEILVDAIEEYEDAADPEFIDVLHTPAGSRYGIRYEEALALEAALQRRNYERLQALTAELESRINALETGV